MYSSSVCALFETSPLIVGTENFSDEINSHVLQLLCLHHPLNSLQQRLKQQQQQLKEYRKQQAWMWRRSPKVALPAW